jgi:uncharacterized membrane protein YbhN (UPF0104 family)
MKKSALRTILVLSITIAIFYFIFTKIDFRAVIEVLSHANTAYLSLAFLLTILIPVISAKRWKIILGSMNFNIPYTECLRMIMGTLPLTSITPSKSGDIIKAYYLRDRVPITKTVGSVLTERVLDILALISFCLIGLAFYQRLRMIILALTILFCIIGFFFISHRGIKLPLKESWDEKLQNILLSTKTLTTSKIDFLRALIHTFTLWFLAIIQTIIFFLALGVNIPLTVTMANIPIAIFIGQIPVTLGGMGTRDAAIVFLFSEYAMPSELLGVGILFSMFRYWLLSLLGIPFMRKMMLLKEI